MHVVQLVIKNASELDFTLPVIWELRRRGVAEVTVVYCVADRSQILRDSGLYREVLGQVGARQMDFGDRLPLRHPIPATLWRRLAAKPVSDEHSIRQNLAALRNRSVAAAERRAALRRLGRAVADRVKRRVQDVALLAARIGRLLPDLSPDVVLLGNRSLTRFPHRSELFAHLVDRAGPVVLVPHAAHETVRDEFTPFDEEGDPLPEFVDYWLVLDSVATPSRFPGREERFTVVGNPCLDEEWAAWLRSRVRMDPSGNRRPSPLRLVVIGRKFEAPGAPNPEDPFTLSFEEMRAHLRDIADGVAGCGHPYAVVMKPHPSTNRFLLTALLQALGLDWEVSFEPVGALCTQAAAVAGLFSTALVMAVPFGCTVIPVASRVQDFVDGRWSAMKDLYHGFESFAENASDLADRLGSAATRQPGGTGSTSEQAHVAKFFAPDALGRCCDRVIELGA